MTEEGDTSRAAIGRLAGAEANSFVLPLAASGAKPLSFMGIVAANFLRLAQSRLQSQVNHECQLENEKQLLKRR